jgi:hypothetical protein
MGTESYWRRTWRENINFTPEELWGAVCEYFDWALENPLYSAQSNSYLGNHEIVKIPRTRVFSKAGLASHLAITTVQWKELGNRPEFAEVIDRAEQIIYLQKYEGAAAGILHTTMMMRDLGMEEVTRNKTELTGPGGGPLSMHLNKDEMIELVRSPGFIEDLLGDERIE